MDPDAIFIILLFIIYLILLVINSIGLIRKIIYMNWPLAIKIILPVLLVGFFIWGPWYFTTTVHTSGISPYPILLTIGALVIGLNWSLNIAKGIQFSKTRLSRSALIILLTIAFTILLPLSLYLLGHIFDSLNIMGSSG